MHLSTLFLLAAPAVLAFTIPDGQAPGVYEVSYENGQEVHTLIRAADGSGDAPQSSSTLSTRSAKFASLAKRNSFDCGGDSLDPSNTDRANSGLDAQCGGGAWVGAGHDFYSISGCTVAYFCNFSGNSQQCYASARQQASAGITGQCGRYQSGWTTYPDAPWSYGYEAFCKSPGSNFCGRGTSG